MHHAIAAARLHPGRRLRQTARPRMVAKAPVPTITNSLVRGEELLDAVLYLGEALGLPGITTTSERTVKVIHLDALRRLAA